MRPSKDKNPLIVKKGPMTRSRANKVKEVMRLLAQVMVDEISITTSKQDKFHVGLGSENKIGKHNSSKGRRILIGNLCKHIVL